MTSFERGRPVLEGGWVLTGTGAEASIKLVFGETELAQAYLGMTVGRHPALCDRVIDDPGISRRHLRVGIADGRLFAEDLNTPERHLPRWRGDPAVSAHAAEPGSGPQPRPGGAHGVAAVR